VKRPSRPTDVEPRRWRERALPTDRRSTSEMAIGDCIRKLPPPRTPPPSWLGTMEARMQRRSPRARQTPRRRFVWSGARALPIIVVSLLLGGAAAAFAGRAILSWHRARQLEPQATAAIAKHDSALRALPPRPASGLATVEPMVLAAGPPAGLDTGRAALPAPNELGPSAAVSATPPPAFGETVSEPGASAGGPVQRGAARRSRVVPSHRGDFSAPLSPVGTRAETSGAEARLLGEGMRLLRTDHDARRALELLNEHERRFPRGVFTRQSNMVRAEVLLALGEPRAALAVMDALPLETSDEDRFLVLARAELRAANARCPDAIGDFGRVLDVDGTDDSAERALYGRAVCRARGGDIIDARADLRTYIARFPHGSKRHEAERTLHRLGS
jgi:hypothetical protein